MIVASSHFKYTLPSANMRIYLNRSAFASEFSLISSITFTLPPAHLCVEVDRGRLAYAAICDKSDCFGPTLLFFFVEPIHR